MRLFVHQLLAEQRLFRRSREAAVFIFAFPLVLFVMLGSVYSGRIYGVPASQALLAGLIGYGAANTSFAGIAITLVIRRENAILKRLRSTPLSLATFVAALLASTLVVFAVETVALFAIGAVVFGAPLPHRVGSLVLAIAFGSLCFAAIGVAVAALIRSAEGASAVVNLILLPMAFLSGSFGPTLHYPRFLRAVGEVLPLRYFIQLVNAIYLHGHAFWSRPGAIAILGGWGVAGLLVALRRFRWEPREG